MADLKDIFDTPPQFTVTGRSWGRWSSGRMPGWWPYTYGGNQFMRQLRHAQEVDPVATYAAFKERFITMDFAAIERRVLLTMLNGGRPPQLLLKGPSDRHVGGTNGVGISIQWMGKPVYIGKKGSTVTRFDKDAMPWPDRQTADMIGGLCAGWGSPHRVCVRVADAMFASGRYDCVVGVSERALDNFETALRQHGATVIITDTWSPKFNAFKDKDIK